MAKAAKSTKVITPKHEQTWEFSVYAHPDPRWPTEYYDVIFDSVLFSVNKEQVGQLIEVLSKVQKAFEKEGN